MACLVLLCLFRGSWSPRLGTSCVEAWYGRMVALELGEAFPAPAAGDCVYAVESTRSGSCFRARCRCRWL